MLPALICSAIGSKYPPQDLVDILNRAITRIETRYDRTKNPEVEVLPPRLVVWIEDIHTCETELASAFLSALVRLNCAKILTTSEEKAKEQFQLGNDLILCSPLLDSF
jgi:hypothetical protein